MSRRRGGRVPALRRALRLLRAAPAPLRIAGLGLGLLVLWLGVNWVYHVVHKPTELFFPVSGALAKTPAETWRRSAPLFRRHATATISPELLAALAQAEGAGDPVARTYWRWQAAWNPFALYRPASSAVGMYQITDATFREARRYCVRDHVVREEDCWFRSLYTRVWPSHAVELTSAWLDRGVEHALARRRAINPTLGQKQDLAAVIHLCGAGPADEFARRGFRPSPTQRCGDHDLAGYVARVNGLKRTFARLAAGRPAEAAWSPAR